MKMENKKGYIGTRVQTLKCNQKIAPSPSISLSLTHSARSLRKYKPKNQSIKLHAKRTQQKKEKNERTKKHCTHTYTQPMRQPSSQQRLNRKEEINLCYTSISYETICTKNWFRSFFVVFSVDVFSHSLLAPRSPFCGMCCSSCYIFASFCLVYLLFPLLTTLTHISHIAASFGLVLIETFMMYIPLLKKRRNGVESSHESSFARLIAAMEQITCTIRTYMCSLHNFYCFQSPCRAILMHGPNQATTRDRVCEWRRRRLCAPYKPCEESQNAYIQSVKQ